MVSAIGPWKISVFAEREARVLYDVAYDSKQMLVSISMGGGNGCLDQE